MDTLTHWQGQFGDEYTERNQYDPTARIPIWHELLPTDIYTVLEVGANYGNNVACLSDLGLDARGIEPNLTALSRAHQLERKVYYGTGQKIRSLPNTYDLVFTCGVLMHIPDYKQVMAEIWRVSKKYVLAIEYQGQDEEIDYRGNAGMLWKRKTYAYPGTLLREGDLGEEFDHCHYWLYEKT